MASQFQSEGRQRKALRIHPEDNVGVALEEIPPGSTVIVAGLGQVMLAGGKPIPFAHKIALTRIENGRCIYKYGVPIAVATADIARGEWVHEHNACSRLDSSRTETAR